MTQDRQTDTSPTTQHKRSEVRQDSAHAQEFDARASLDSRNLVRNYESFHDVRFLGERLRGRPRTLLEIGCATGEFSRYLAIRFPHIRYVGVDISEPAIRCAKKKYSKRQFVLTEPGMPLIEVRQRCGNRRAAPAYP